MINPQQMLCTAFSLHRWRPYPSPFGSLSPFTTAPIRRPISPNQRSPRPLAGLKGPTSKGRRGEGRRREEEEREGRRMEGNGGEGPALRRYGPTNG